MTDLTKFLRARLGEDEQVTFNPALMPVIGPGLSDLVKRARTEIEAKRRIVDAYETAVAEFADSGPAMASYDRLTGSVSSLRHALELLALPYVDHPDYDAAWAVTRERA